MRAGPGIGCHRQRLRLGRQELLAETWPTAAAALPLLIAVAVIVLRRAIAVVHGSGVNAAARLALPGALSRTMARLARLAVTVLAGALLMAAALALSLRLSALRGGSTAPAAPSASFPSAGLPGRRVRSLIHASLVSQFPQVAGSHIWTAFAGLLLALQTAESAIMRLESFSKSSSLRPSGAWTCWRMERLHGGAAIGGHLYGTQLSPWNASSKPPFLRWMHIF